MYVRLVTFHASMYFSMHALRQPCSFELRLEPGDETQCWKQVSLTLEIRYLAFMMLDCMVMADCSRAFMAADSEEVVGGGCGGEGVDEDDEDDEEKGLGKPPKDILVGYGWL
jgi:hypothetical protein